MNKLLWLVLAVLLLTAVAVSAADPGLVMKAGGDFRAILTWKDKSGTAINLNGYSYAAQFRSAPGGTLFASYSCVITDAAGGVMQLRLSRAQTAKLAGKSGVWDLKQTDPGGLVTYQFGGTAIVNPTVTQ